MDGLHSRVQNEIKHWAACMPIIEEIEPLIPNFEDITIGVCTILDTTTKEMFSKTRLREIVFKRQVAHAVAYAFSKHYGAEWSLAVIGENLGKKDHSTVLFSIKAISNMIDTRYKKKEISATVDHFNLKLEDFIYRPRKTFRYSKVKITTGTETRRFDTIREAAWFLDVSKEKITNAAYSNKKIRWKYSVEFETIKELN